MCNFGVRSRFLDVIYGVRPPNGSPESSYLSIFLFILQVMTSKPSQHTMSDPHWYVHKMPFIWHFAGGPTLARFFMFSLDVSFDIMRNSTNTFSDKHFSAQKSLHDETVLLSPKNLR